MTSTPIAVRVPASTSNLGTGFDLLGLALALYLDVELVGRGPAGEHTRIESSGESAGPLARGDLLLAAFEHGARRLGLEAGPLALRVRSGIPPERGLGSSGAAIVAGLLLANRLAARRFDETELLTCAFELDGHPDNVTPALRGGCHLSIPTPAGLLAIPQPVHPTIHVALAWPATRIPTRAARAILAETVPLRDAVENSRRLVCLLEGLRSGRPDLLELGGEDRLHVPQRLCLVPGAESALRAAREAGAWLATLSGSGSGLVALGAADRVESIAEALGSELRRKHSGVQARVISIETRGARVVTGTLEDLPPL